MCAQVQSDSPSELVYLFREKGHLHRASFEIMACAESCAVPIDDMDWECMLDDALQVPGKEAAADEDPLMCFFCEEYLICKNQIFGTCCAKDYRGAARDAKDQGKVQLAAFKLMVKRSLNGIMFMV